MSSKITRSLACDLKQDELLTKGDELSTICQEINELEYKKSAQAKRLKEEIDVLEEKRYKLAGIVKSRQEYRDVECQEKFDYVRREVVTIRLDTGEIVASRAMDLHEYQIEMDLHENPAESLANG